jgi:tRNA A37 threonylcarbamoyladenosine dehydratase
MCLLYFWQDWDGILCVCVCVWGGGGGGGWVNEALINIREHLINAVLSLNYK